MSEQTNPSQSIKVAERFIAFHIVGIIQNVPHEHLAGVLQSALEQLEAAVPDMRDDPRIMALVVEQLAYRLDRRRKTGEWEKL